MRSIDCCADCLSREVLAAVRSRKRSVYWRSEVESAAATEQREINEGLVMPRRILERVCRDMEAERAVSVMVAPVVSSHRPICLPMI